MSMNSNSVFLLNEFKSKKDIYKQLEEKATITIKNIISENSFFVMDIQHRVKDDKSLEGKLIKKDGKYKNLYEITDLVGFRIICYFSDTVDKIAEEIKKYFVIDTENSIDKRTVLDVTQFGYLSLHYICRLNKSEEIDEELSKIPFEIQIRTVLQHAWAEIEHDLGYKSDFGVPKPIRRNFSRIAGLLEIADSEFINLRDSSKKYTEEIREKIENDKGYDISLDKVSFNEYIHKSRQFKSFVENLKNEFSLDVEIIETGFTYLKQLEWLGNHTIGDFYNLFESNRTFVYKQIKNLVENFGIDIITSTAILKFLTEGELLLNDYSEKQIIQFLSIAESDDKQIERSLKHILKMKESL